MGCGRQCKIGQLFTMFNQDLQTKGCLCLYIYLSRAGWIGPTGMFLLFLVSTVVNKMLMKPVINTTVNLEKREGDFRFKHIMVSFVFGGPFAKELIQIVAERKETMCCLLHQSPKFDDNVFSFVVFTTSGTLVNFDQIIH